MTRLGLELATALTAVAVTGAITDLRFRTIPNVLTAGGALTGFVLQTWLHGWGGVKTSLFGFAVGLAIFLPLFVLRGMGGGDVKLLAAIGAIAGPTNTIIIFIFTALFGGALSLLLLLWKGGLGRALANASAILGDLAHLRTPQHSQPDLTIDNPQAVKLPYGVAIALGALAFLAL